VVRRRVGMKGEFGLILQCAKVRGSVFECDLIDLTNTRLWGAITQTQHR
jgi:hypothetical protein